MTAIEITEADRKRFWSLVEKRGEFECWPWRGSPAVKGYGRFFLTRRKSLRAHRLALILTSGPIPASLVVDHICRQRDCCNPAHLRAISNAENVLIGVGPTAQNARKTHCKRGHELAGWNLILRGKCRNCRRCRYDAQNLRKRERLAEAARIRSLAHQSPAESVEGEGATRGHQSTGNALSEAPGRNGRDGEKA